MFRKNVFMFRKNILMFRTITFIKIKIIMKKLSINYNDKAKKINAMSQSSWQIGRPDLNAFFLNFFFLSSRRLRFESVTAQKYGTWFLIEQDTRQNTELKKSVVQSISLCLSYLFLYILTSKFIKNWKKN